MSSLSTNVNGSGQLTLSTSTDNNRFTLAGNGQYAIVSAGFYYNSIDFTGNRQFMAFGFFSPSNSMIVRVGTTEFSVVLNVSDYRIKENIRPTNNVLDRLCSINMFHYTFKRLPELLNENQNNTPNQLGFFAHELQEMFPEYEYLVLGTKDDVNKDGSMKMQQINSFQFGNILMKSIQEQNAEVNQLNAEVNQLKIQLQEQNAEVNQLKIQLQEQNEKFNQLILTTQTLQAEIQELKSANNTVP